MKKRILNLLIGLVAVSVSSLGFASFASASVVYNIDIDSCSSGCGLSSYGTVTVTQILPTQLQVTIALAPGVFFNQAGGGFAAVAFDLAGNPAISISGLPSTFTANGSQSAGSYHEDGLGNWDYIVNWVGPPTNNGNLPGGGVSGLTFDIAGLVPLALDFTASHSADVYFSIDVTRGPTGPTGVVGATKAHSSVPEPTTIALIIACLMSLASLRAIPRRTLQSSYVRII